MVTYEDLEDYFADLKNPFYANTLRRFFTKVSADWCSLNGALPVTPMNKVWVCGFWVREVLDLGEWSSANAEARMNRLSGS